MSDWLDRFAEEIGAAPAAAVPAKSAPVLFNARGVPVNQLRPTHDPATDGNVFDWILRATKQVRIQEQAANEVRRIRLQVERRSLMPVLVDRSRL